MKRSFVGIDLGAETAKIVDLSAEGRRMRAVRVEHGKAPGAAVISALSSLGGPGPAGAAVCGRLGAALALPRVPDHAALAEGFRGKYGRVDATVISIGGRGFSVHLLREGRPETVRENPRCAQGTGNFLRQLVERLGLSVGEADAIAWPVDDPVPLRGRCPVLLKSDLTHLANQGERRPRLLAGLFDALCENVLALLPVRACPREVRLIGGVARSKRVRRYFRDRLQAHGLSLLEGDEDDEFLEALGAALVAARSPAPPPLEAWIAPSRRIEIDRVPALATSLKGVVRLAPGPLPAESATGRVVFGLDIGSTGAKAVALDAATAAIVWEDYRPTGGDPAAAARSLLGRFVSARERPVDIVAFGATGSGRQVVGSLLAACYGSGAVWVMNEIVAHAEGALYFDASVDTIFEIGGQDAKYIRLDGGRVIDAAMNEACSAGTGSYVEEQGTRLAGVPSLALLEKEALGADYGASLGQHCTVLMSEVIDAAVAGGESRGPIAAGLYDSVARNYLHRVKGDRSVGRRVFCQGMPFQSDALAAAMARLVGGTVIVPPNPGTVGALGIALLARKALDATRAGPFDPTPFLETKVIRKESFRCSSSVGCGEPGRMCAVERLHASAGGRALGLHWGGSCSLWGSATRRKRLPDRASDPFREREARVAALLSGLPSNGGARVAVPDDLGLRALLPFFATYLAELGCAVSVRRGGGRAALRRGVEEASVPFCAPMQHYYGTVRDLGERTADRLFVPMLCDSPRTGPEETSTQCPIVQGSADVIRADLAAAGRARLLSPVFHMGPGGLGSKEFRQGCRELAGTLGVARRWEEAHRRGVAAQERFERECREIGRLALEYARAHGVVPVVVLGRTYVVHNETLCAGVPSVLRELGAMPVPVDCFEAGPDAPVLQGIYWGEGRRCLRAAYEIRRTPGLYGLWCTNFGCGPDGFVQQFFGHLMAGKPFAVVESDGHHGDAGVRTRVEAFLACVEEDRGRQEHAPPSSAALLEPTRVPYREVRARGETLLVPFMGEGSEVAAACLRGTGLRVESLPMADRHALLLGRRHTSGKECLPMCITLGALLARLEREPDADARFTVLLPCANGPCRFGVYNLLDRIVLDRLGWSGRVRISSPASRHYFEGMPPGASAVVFTGLAAMDLLLAALHDVRPVERHAGTADRIFARYKRALLDRVEAATRRGPAPGDVLLNLVPGGGLFGCERLLREAAREFARERTDRAVPTVGVVGAVYVRLDPFACGFIIDELERHGLRARLAPVGEWIDYIDDVNLRFRRRTGLGARLSTMLKRWIRGRTYALMAGPLGWPPRTRVRDEIEAAKPYLREDLLGEAVLSVGGPVFEHRQGLIDAVVNVGPLECLPCRIAESHLLHAARREGLLSLSVSFNGDPVDPNVVADFAYEVHARFRNGRRRNGGRTC